MNITTTYPYINLTAIYTPEIKYISIYTTFLFYGYVLFFVRMCIHLFPLTMDDFNPFGDLFMLDDFVEQKQEPAQPEKYSEKYKKEYSQITNCVVSDDRLSILENSVIIENTPVGCVLMYYKHNNDDKTGMFHYYSNNTIPYGFLEVVARKYVVTFNCKQLYICNDEEPVKILQEECSTKSFTTSNTNKSVFVKFKNYNTGTTLNKTQGVTDTIDTPILKQINVFKSKGRIANYNFLKKVDRKLVDANYSMTFSNYKKMMSL